MDAVEFLRERKRMCDSREDCDGCPLAEDKCIVSSVCDEDYKKIVAAIEQWSKEHPRKTRQSEFLKHYPNVELDGNGIINISPCRVDPKQYPFNGEDCRKFRSCGDCLREFWMQEVE